jgi:hypothetical protein
MYAQQLGHIVNGLLRSHSMVILPGFGGLVLERVPAQLDPQRGRLTPPSDVLMFNARLHHNDGLLVQAVAEKWDFPLNEADSWLTDAITELRFVINGGGRVEWPCVGTFNRNVEGRIHFVAAGDRSSAPDTFGLRPLQLTEVQRTTDLRVRTVQAARALPAKRIIGYAAAAMAVGLLAWLPFQQGVVDGGKQFVAEMGLMNLQSQATYAPRTFVPLWESSTPSNDVVIDESPADITTASEESNHTTATTVSYPTRFHVVAATFETRNEAESFRAKLESRGFQAQLAGTDANGQHAVSYGLYDGLNNAEAMLASVRLSNGNAHILPAN